METAEAAAAALDPRSLFPRQKGQIYREKTKNNVCFFYKAKKLLLLFLFR